jgi:hypothetical protein
MSCIILVYDAVSLCLSCISNANNLDEQSIYRSHEHTNLLLEAHTLQELWDDYGILGDIVVSILPT